MASQLTVRDASIFLRISPATVRSWISRGFLRAKKRNGRYYINLASILQVIDEEELLGRSVFDGSVYIQRLLATALIVFEGLLQSIEAVPTESDQLKLLDVGWLILSTKFWEEYAGATKSSRKIVLDYCRKYRKNDKFGALGLLEDRYDALSREADVIR